MPCYYPLEMYRQKSGPNPNGKWPLTPNQKHADQSQESVKVPCGRCIGCRLERSRQWAIRCEHERSLHEQSCFVTFTYHDDNVPYGDSGNLTLNPRHLQLFFKKLRKQLDPVKIRYFACGEYGSRTSRPHYHAIIFGWYPPDAKLYSTSMGNNIYVSGFLNSTWGLGNCPFGDATFESSAYVARYICDKKLGRLSSFYEDNGIEPEFVRMSRNPGIGSDWYDKYQTDLWPVDQLVIRNGIVTKPGRYYTKKLESSSPELHQKIKDERIKMASRNGPETRFKRRAQKEAVKLASISQMQRDKIA